MSDLICFVFSWLACTESVDINGTLPIIAGAIWEFTDNWDCFGNELALPSTIAWGNQGAIDGRRMCAAKCLENPNCNSFNYPKDDYWTFCVLKFGLTKSIVKDWECNGYNTTQWQYYALLERKPDCIGNENIRFSTIGPSKNLLI